MVNEKMLSYEEYESFFRHRISTLRKLNCELEAFFKLRKKINLQEVVNQALSLDNEQREEFFKSLEKIDASLDDIPKYRGYIAAHKISTITDSEIDVAFKKALGSFCLNSEFFRIIREMSLTQLITSFEDYLKNILQKYFQEDPRILISDNKSLNFEEILSCKDINEVRKKIIEKELGRFSYKSIEEINDFLIKKIKLDLSRNIFWDLFKESFFRRNLFVHNDGFVNDLYLSNTHLKYPIGQKLNIDKKYLEEQFEFFLEISKQIKEHVMSRRKDLQ